MKDQLDNAIYDCFRIARIMDDFRMKWAADAIARYIHTGRASTLWVKSFLKANKTRLLARVVHGSDLSDLAMVETATKYLQRYCKLAD